MKLPKLRKSAPAPAGSKPARLPRRLALRLRRTSAVAPDQPESHAVSAIPPVHPATVAAPTAPLAAEPVTLPVPASPPPAAPAAPARPDPQVEAQLKKFADQLAKVSSGLDAQRTEAKEVHQKLGSIEEQLRSFLTLSEALSNQFNPMATTFKDAPPPATQVQAQGEEPASLPPRDAPVSPPIASAPQPLLASPAALPIHGQDESPHASDHGGLIMDAEGLLMPPAPGEPTHPAPSLGHGSVQGPPAHASNARGPLLDDFPSDPEASLAALAWLDQLAQSVGTEGVRRLLQYYESIGWVGPRAHVRLLTLAAGLPPRAPPAQAPSALDVHASSYQHLERLRAPRAGDGGLRVPSIPGSVLATAGEFHGR